MTHPINVRARLVRLECDIASANREIDDLVYELYGISDEDLCTRPGQIAAQVRLFRVCPFWESRKVTVRALCTMSFKMFVKDN